MTRTYATLGSDGILTAAQRPAAAGLTKLSGQTIQITQTTIAHGLGGTPSVVIISPRGVSFVYESQVADGTNVYMTAAGITTADIYVAL
jgi:hypothetical protein